MEAHYIKPISEMKDDEKISRDDIIMLCSNSHRMLYGFFSYFECGCDVDIYDWNTAPLGVCRHV